MVTHSSTLAWKIPWTEEPGRLLSMGSLRVGHDWATSFSLFTFMHWRRKWQPTPVFLPGESQGRWSPVGFCLWGRTESDMTWNDLAAAAKVKVLKEARGKKRFSPGRARRRNCIRLVFKTMQKGVEENTFCVEGKKKKKPHREFCSIWNYPSKEEIFLYKLKFREFVTNGLPLQELLKEILKGEGK